MRAAMLGLRWMWRGRGAPFGMPAEPLWLRAKGDGKKPKGAAKGKKEGGGDEGKGAAAKGAADKKPAAAAAEEEEEVYVEKKKKIEMPIFYKEGAYCTAKEAYASTPPPKSDKRMKKFRQSFSMCFLALHIIRIPISQYLP